MDNFQRCPVDLYYTDIAQDISKKFLIITISKINKQNNSLIKK